MAHRSTADAPHHRREDGDPVAPEIDDQRQGGAQVQSDHKRQERVGALVDVPAEQLRRNHSVAQAADREQLGYTLKKGKDDDLREGQRGRGGRGSRQNCVSQTRIHADHQSLYSILRRG